MSDNRLADIDTVRVEEIWYSVLGQGPTARDATFFELGGESIAAVRIVSQVEEHTGISVDVGDVFETDPTLAMFLQMVAEKAHHAA